MRTTVTQEYLLGKVKDVEYVVMSDKRTTLCTLTMRNGYTVRGESSCVHAANFDAALGRRYAYDDAVKKLWPLEGYLLAEELHRASGKPDVPNPVHDEPTL